MKTDTLSYLDALSSRQSEMLQLLRSWADISSGSSDIQGLKAMADALEKEFSSLGADYKRVALAPRRVVDLEGNQRLEQVGEALVLNKRPNAPIQLFFGGHYDTVFGPESSFKKTEIMEGRRLRGPGVADMKGGLVVMLETLRFLESCPWSERIGWRCILNPDEEIGSGSSESLFIEAARKTQLALLFEPSYPDGALVSARKGSTNYTLICRGVAAHAGREFDQGRNAIAALSRTAAAIDALNGAFDGCTFNIGRFSGGKATNIVPDLAICHVNIRMQTLEQLQEINTRLQSVVDVGTLPQGVTLTLIEETARAPKMLTPDLKKWCTRLENCASELSQEISWRESGGVCDGNIFAGSNVPALDTLGVIGGNLHTEDEYMEIDSLLDKLRLATHFVKTISENGVS